MSIFLHWPDSVLAFKYWQWLANGWSVTIISSLLVMAFATLLGAMFAVARNAAAAPLRWVSGLYLSIFRNTPLLVQLFLWYFGVPSLLPPEWMTWLNTKHQIYPAGLPLAWPSFEFLSACVGLIFYSTAYVGEEIRAGIQSVARSQTQAALSLGMTRWQLLRFIVLPQALAKVISPLFGQYMNIVKNTSLGMTIGLVELSYRARQAEAETFQSFQVYGITTALYIVLVMGLELLSQQLQNRRPWGQLSLRHK